MEYVNHVIYCSYCNLEINSRRSIGESLDMLRNHIRAKHDKQVEPDGSDYTSEETGR